MDGFLEIPLHKIVWRSPIREEIIRKDVENMSTSLMIHGLVHPIVVTPADDNGLFYEGVCGRLRYESAKHRGFPCILARVHRFESEEEKLEWQLAENLHRRDIPVTARAAGYAKLKKLVAGRVKRETGEEPSEKAILVAIVEEQQKLTGEKKAEETVRQYLKIASDLPKEVKKSIVDYALGMAHCQELLRVKDLKLQLWLAEEAGKAKWTQKKLRQTINDFQRVNDDVKRAVFSHEIALGHLKQLTRLHPHQQDKVLKLIKRDGLVPKDTKPLVDLILQKPEETDRLTSLSREELEAESRGEVLLRTPEDVEKAFEEAEERLWQVEHRCPQCGKIFKINWEEGTIQWDI